MGGDAGAAADAGDATPAEPSDGGAAPLNVPLSDAGVPNCDFQDGLLAWWSAEGNTTNAIDGTEATFNGTYVTGRAGQGFSFDGESQFVELEAFTAPAAGLTLDAWVYLNEIEEDATQFIAAQWSDADHAFALAVTTRSQAPLADCTTDGPAVYMRVNTTDGVSVACSSVAIEPGGFYHLAGSFDVASGEVSVYVNGDKVGEASVAPGSTLLDSVANVQLGARDADTVARLFFNGVIDEVDVFEGALEDSAIEALSDGELGPKCQ